MMERLVAVFSDVHGNDAALACVLQDARQQAAACGLPLHYWFLGDIANGLPGVDNALCMLEELSTDLRVWLMGNHDLAQLCWWPQPDQPHLLPSRANRDTLRSEIIRYMRDQHEIDLLMDDLLRLEQIRVEYPTLWQRWAAAPTWTSIQEPSGVFMAHGMIINAQPDHPANTIFGLLDSKMIDLLDHAIKLVGEAHPVPPRLVLLGHTHIATAWTRRGTDQWANHSVGSHDYADFKFGHAWYALDPDCVWVLNVGSVGWQREGDSGPHGRSAAMTGVYLLLHIDAAGGLRCSFRNPAYDLDQALKRYSDLGAPSLIMDRIRAAR